MQLAGWKVQAKTVSPAWCSNTLLRPSLLPLLTYPLLSSAHNEKAPLEPCVRPLEPPALPRTPRLRGWREVACHTKGKSHNLSYNPLSLQPAGFAWSPGVKEKEIASVTAIAWVCPLHPSWLPIPSLCENPWIARDVGIRFFTIP